MAGNVTGSIGNDYVEFNNAATESTLQALLNAIQGNSAQVKNLAGKSGVKNSGTGGNDNLKANNQTVAENTGVFKRLSTFGQGAADSFYKLDNQISPLIGQLIKGNASITVVTDTFGRLNPLLGVAADLFGRLVRFQEENFEAYRTMTNVGVGFSGSLTDLRMAASNSYLTLGEFTNVIKTNSESFTRIGGSANEGAIAFSKFSNNFMKSDAGSQVMALGFTAEQANQYLATYVTNAGASNVKDLQTNEKLRAGASQYLEELDRLAEITGKSRDELNEQRKIKNLEADAALTAARMKPKEREAFLANYNYMKNMYGAAGADIALAQAQGRSVITKEGQLLTAITGGAAQTAMQHLNDTAKIYGVGSKEYIATQNEMSLAMQGGINQIPDAVFSANDAFRNALTPAIRTTADQMASGLTTNEAFNSRDAKLKQEQIARQNSQAATMAESEKAMKNLSQAVLGLITPIVSILTPVIKFMAFVVDTATKIIEKYTAPLAFALATAVAVYAFKNREAMANSVKNAGASAVNYIAGSGKGGKGRSLLSGIAGAVLTRDGSSPERALYVIMTGGGTGSIGDILENNNKKTGKMSEAGEKRRAAREAAVNRGRAMQTLGKGTNILKSGLKAAKGGIVGLTAGLALDYGSDLAKEKGMNKTAAGLNVASEAATWAGTGALVGSFVPILGTAVGAAVGGIAGGIYGLAQNWETLFKEEKAQKDKLPDSTSSSDQEIIASLRTMAAEAEKSRKLQERSVRHLDDINNNVDNSGPPSFYG